MPLLSRFSLVRLLIHPYLLFLYVGFLSCLILFVCCVLALTGLVAFPLWAYIAVLSIVAPAALLAPKFEKRYVRKLSESLELQSAIASTDASRVRELLKKGYPLHVFPIQSQLYTAVIYGDLEIVQILLDAGANPLEKGNAVGEKSESALDIARELNRIEILRLFER